MFSAQKVIVRLAVLSLIRISIGWFNKTSEFELIVKSFPLFSVLRTTANKQAICWVMRQNFRNYNISFNFRNAANLSLQTIRGPSTTLILILLLNIKCFIPFNLIGLTLPFDLDKFLSSSASGFLHLFYGDHILNLAKIKISLHFPNIFINWTTKLNS